MGFFDDNLTLIAFKERFKSDLACEYSSLITYQRNSVTFDKATTKVYKSIIFNNLGNLLTDTAKWSDISTSDTLDQCVVDDLISSEINAILANNDILSNKIISLYDTDRLKLEATLLFIAHNIQQKINASLGVNVSSVVTPSGILTSSSDGANSASLSLLPYMKDPMFSLYSTTRFGMEYYLILASISDMFNIIITKTGLDPL